MHCPKCGGEIPFYDLKPNCKHCGVNIMFYTQNDALTRDAKRSELEGAAARMVIARIKANFIGGKLQIARLVFVLIAVAALLVPFGGVRYSIPFFTQSYSAGIIGIVGAVQNGFLLQIPAFLGSALLSEATIAAAVPTIFLVLCALLDVVVFAAFLLGFLNLTRSMKFIRAASLVGVFLSAAAQIAELIVKAAIPDSIMHHTVLGFGALAAAAMYLVLFFLNRALMRKGIEPQYRENDLKRRDMLRRVRAGEVDLDTLPLPIFESDEERETRLHALEEALRAEEEGKEL